MCGIPRRVRAPRVHHPVPRLAVRALGLVPSCIQAKTIWAITIWAITVQAIIIWAITITHSVLCLRACVNARARVCVRACVRECARAPCASVRACSTRVRAHDAPAEAPAVKNSRRARFSIWWTLSSLNHDALEGTFTCRVMACIVIGLHSYGLYSYGLYSYGLYELEPRCPCPHMHQRELTGV